jgi:hypothetical protein
MLTHTISLWKRLRQEYRALAFFCKKFASSQDIEQAALHWKKGFWPLDSGFPMQIVQSWFATKKISLYT